MRSYPALVSFTDGKITGLIEGSEKDPLTIKGYRRIY